MRLVVAVVALLLLATSAFAQKTSWSNCVANPQLQITNLTLNPDPPQAGANFSVFISGKLGESISGGSLYLNVTTYFAGTWVPVPGSPFTFEICSIAPCPIPAGTFAKGASAEIPIIAPPGQYQGTIKITDQSNNVAACIAWSTSMLPPQ